jgi:hypothetical protein
MSKVLSVRVDVRHERALEAHRLGRESTSDLVRRIIEEYCAAVPTPERRAHAYPTDGE